MRFGRLALACALVGCTNAEQLPPPGEVLVVVDTDAPVPGLVSRLRLDTYAIQGDNLVWFDSREAPLPNPEDWPVSFSVYRDETHGTSEVLVRLRAFAEGKVRDYRGERFAPLADGAAPGDPADTTDPPAGEVPRLVVGGIDATPPSEPQPNVAIDRLVTLDIAYGSRASATIVLHGECAGTQADLLGRRSCNANEQMLEPASRPKTSSSMDTPATSTRVATFPGAAPCTVPPRPATNAADGTPLHDDEVCVPGGLVVVGSPELAGQTPIDAVPERPAVVRPLLVDRWEVTVARWRKAIADGLSVSPYDTPIPNDGPLASGSSAPASQNCSYSVMPRAREDYALTCIPWTGARAFCQFYGGDLLTEAEWEHAAATFARDTETRYPWGSDDPTCAAFVFGRYDDPLSADDECFKQGLPFGPQPVTASTRDVTPGAVGIAGLGGGVSEWVRDAFHTYDSVCWAAASMFDRHCDDDGTTLRSRRGGAWTGYDEEMLAAYRARDDKTAFSTDIGFRCARQGSAP